MTNTQKLDTHHKALTLNLDPSTFVSFVEIGACHEVARWCPVVGGASGTVAKTISVCDKEVSDDLYGSGSQYVSKQRLEAMLDKESADLQTQLGKTRGLQTRFFSFADTGTARNYTGRTMLMAGPVEETGRPMLTSRLKTTEIADEQCTFLRRSGIEI